MDRAVQPSQSATTSADTDQSGTTPTPQAIDAAATAATANMAAAIVQQRLVAPAQQQGAVQQAVQSSMPALQQEVVPELAAATAGAANKSTTPGPGFGTAAFEALLDKSTASTAHTDDSNVQMLFDGVSSFAERERLLANAKTSICLETYIFTEDATGTHTSDLLCAAAQRGVKVMLLYDSLGSSRAPESMFDYMRKQGVEVRVYNKPSKVPLFDINHRNHVKSLIVDGQEAILGGMNVADEYAFGGTDTPALERKKGKGGWRDVDVAVTGAAVGDAQKHFLGDWALMGPAVSPEAQNQLDNQDAKPAGATSSSVRIIEHRPLEHHDQNTENAYLAAINATEHTIEIENPYFLPPSDIRNALIAAAQRGVQVRVRTNSMASSDMHADIEVAHHYYPQLMAAGIQIYEENAQMVHSKTASFDGKFSLVGSMNLNGRSKGRDAEALVAISDSGTANTLTKRFDYGLVDETTLVTPADLKREQPWTHLKEWSLSLVSWTL